MGSITGYVEGFYGRLLDWADRVRLLDSIAKGGMNSYFYAPKDDPLHRQHWRQPYDKDWLEHFSNFANAAADRGVSVIAGIAPGLDFDFGCLDRATKRTDLSCLVDKAKSLVGAGATHVALMMDDIDADFDKRRCGFNSEGSAHGALTNRLGEALGVPVILVPRIYADSLSNADDPQSLTYLVDLAASLASQHRPIYCGDDIVARTIGADAGGHLDSKRVIVWDNFYANDYCPRRLFIGPWRNRGKAANLLLNPTGMIETDLVLLALMAASREMDSQAACKAAWQEVITEINLPDAFAVIAFYLDAPFGFTPAFDIPNDDDALAALDDLLWRWKAPLQREWYPILMGLKQDILIANGNMSAVRMGKTQLLPLANTLNSSRFVSFDD